MTTPTGDSSGPPPVPRNLRALYPPTRQDQGFSRSFPQRGAWPYLRAPAGKGPNQGQTAVPHVADLVFGREAQFWVRKYGHAPSTPSFTDRRDGVIIHPRTRELPKDTENLCRSGVRHLDWPNWPSSCRSAQPTSATMGAASSSTNTDHAATRSAETVYAGLHERSCTLPSPIPRSLVDFVTLDAIRRRPVLAMGHVAGMS
jgi:hypothetical protein